MRLLQIEKKYMDFYSCIESRVSNFKQRMRRIQQCFESLVFIVYLYIQKCIKPLFSFENFAFFSLNLYLLVISALNVFRKTVLPYFNFIIHSHS